MLDYKAKICLILDWLGHNNPHDHVLLNNPKIVYGLTKHFEEIWSDQQTKTFQS
jgi:hypothetical protein